MANWQGPPGYSYPSWNNQVPMAGVNPSIPGSMVPQVPYYSNPPVASQPAFATQQQYATQQPYATQQTYTTQQQYATQQPYSTQPYATQQYATQQPFVSQHPYIAQQPLATQPPVAQPFTYQPTSVYQQGMAQSVVAPPVYTAAPAVQPPVQHPPPQSAARTLTSVPLDQPQHTEADSSDDNSKKKHADKKSGASKTIGDWLDKSDTKETRKTSERERHRGSTDSSVDRSSRRSRSPKHRRSRSPKRRRSRSPNIRNVLSPVSDGDLHISDSDDTKRQSRQMERDLRHDRGDRRPTRDRRSSSMDRDNYKDFQGRYSDRERDFHTSRRDSRDREFDTRNNGGRQLYRSDSQDRQIYGGDSPERHVDRRDVDRRDIRDMRDILNERRENREQFIDERESLDREIRQDIRSRQIRMNKRRSDDERQMDRRHSADRQIDRRDLVDNRDRQLTRGGSRDRQLTRGGSRDRQLTRGGSRDRQLTRGGSRDRQLTRGGSRDRQLTRGGSRDRQLTRGGSRDRQLTRGGSRDRQLTRGGSRDRQLHRGGSRERQSKRGGSMDRHKRGDSWDNFIHGGDTIDKQQPRGNSRDKQLDRREDRLRNDDTRTTRGSYDNRVGLTDEQIKNERFMRGETTSNRDRDFDRRDDRIRYIDDRSMSPVRRDERVWSPHTFDDRVRSFGWVAKQSDDTNRESKSGKGTRDDRSSKGKSGDKTEKEKTSTSASSSSDIFKRLAEYKKKFNAMKTTEKEPDKPPSKIVYNLSPVKQSSQKKTPGKPAVKSSSEKTPARASSQRSTAKPSRPKSPIKLSVKTPVKPASQNSPVKPPVKTPDKPARRKSPVKPPVKTPDKPARRKSPVKPLVKTPDKPARGKSPVKPAIKTPNQKSPVNPSRQKSPVRQPVKRPAPGSKDSPKSQQKSPPSSSRATQGTRQSPRQSQAKKMKLEEDKSKKPDPKPKVVETKEQFMKRKAEELQSKIVQMKAKVAEKRKAETEAKTSTPQKVMKISDKEDKDTIKVEEKKSDREKTKSDTSQSKEKSKEKDQEPEQQEKKLLPKIPLKKTPADTKSADSGKADTGTNKESESGQSSKGRETRSRKSLSEVGTSSKTSDTTPKTQDNKEADSKSGKDKIQENPTGRWDKTNKQKEHAEKESGETKVDETTNKNESGKPPAATKESECKIDRSEISEVLKMVFDDDEEMGEISNIVEVEAGPSGAESQPAVEPSLHHGKLGNHPRSKFNDFVKNMKDPDEPLVGLQYITEIIHKQDRGFVYRCFACSSKNLGKAVIDHIIGYKHRVNYLERNWPDTWSNLKRIVNRRQTMNMMVRGECILIEKEVGRQKIVCIDAANYKTPKLSVKRLMIADVKVLVSLSKEEFKMPSRQEQAKVPTPVKAAPVQHKTTEPVKVAPAPAPAKAVATPASARPPDKPGPAGNMQQVKVDSSAVTVEHKQGTVKKAADVKPAIRPAVQPAAKPAVKPSPEDLLQQSIDAAVERATPVSYTDGKHCVTFYKFIQNKPDVPMLGLSDVVEISGFKKGVAVRYLCKLCKGSLIWGPRAMLEHTQGLKHMEMYLEKLHPRKVNMFDHMENEKQRKMAVDKQARLAYGEDGRGDLHVANLDERVKPAPPPVASPAPKPPVASPAPTPPVAKVEAKAPASTTAGVTATATSQAGTKPTANTMDADAPLTIKEADSKDVTVLLFELLKKLENIPVVGLNYITEICHADNKTRPVYQCKLCDTTHSVNFINAHLTSHDHRYRFLRNNYPLLYSRTAGNRDLVNKYVKEIEGRYGRESVWQKTLVARGPNGMPIYSEPIFVKGPWAGKTAAGGGEGKEDTVKEADKKEASAGNHEAVYSSATQVTTAQHHTEFDKIIEGLDYTPLLGLQYVTEIQHPHKLHPAKYECLLCHHVGNGTPLTTTNILNHIAARAHRMNFFRETHEEMYKQIIACRDRADQNMILAKYTKEIESTVGRGAISHMVTTDLSYWVDDEDHAAKEFIEGSGRQGGEAPPTSDAASAKATPPQPPATGPAKPAAAKEPVVVECQPLPPPSLTDVPLKLQLLPKTSTLVKDVMIKTDGAFSWKVEFEKLQARIRECSIIVSDRKSRYKTAYDTFLSNYPVIGVQWILEVQRTNVRMEPYYLCRLCEERIIWKKIVYHVNGLRHRICYMGQCYPLMYQFICQKKFTNIAGLRVRIDLFAEEIVKKEGRNQQPQVLLELDASNKTGPPPAAPLEQTGLQALKPLATPPTSVGKTPFAASRPSQVQAAREATTTSANYPRSASVTKPNVTMVSEQDIASSRYLGTIYKTSAPVSSPATSLSSTAIGMENTPGKARPVTSHSNQRELSIPKSDLIDISDDEKEADPIQESDLIDISDDEKEPDPNIHIPEGDLIDISDDEKEPNQKSIVSESDLIDISDDELDRPLNENELKAIEEAYIKRLEDDDDILGELCIDDAEELNVGVDDSSPESSGQLEISVSLGPSVFEVTNSHIEQPRSSADIPGLTLVSSAKAKEGSPSESMNSGREETSRKSSEITPQNVDKENERVEDISDNKVEVTVCFDDDNVDKISEMAKSSVDNAKTIQEAQIKANVDKSKSANVKLSAKAKTDEPGKVTGKGFFDSKPGTSKGTKKLVLSNKRPVVILERLSEAELLKMYQTSISKPSTSSASSPSNIKKATAKKTEDDKQIEDKASKKDADNMKNIESTESSISGKGKAPKGKAPNIKGKKSVKKEMPDSKSPEMQAKDPKSSSDAKNVKEEHDKTLPMKDIPKASSQSSPRPDSMKRETEKNKQRSLSPNKSINIKEICDESKSGKQTSKVLSPSSTETVSLVSDNEKIKQTRSTDSKASKSEEKKSQNTTVKEVSKTASPAVKEVSKTASPAFKEVSKAASPAVKEVSKAASPAIKEMSKTASPSKSHRVDKKFSERKREHHSRDTIVKEVSKTISPTKSLEGDKKLTEKKTEHHSSPSTSHKRNEDRDQNKSRKDKIHSPSSSRKSDTRNKEDKTTEKQLDRKANYSPPSPKAPEETKVSIEIGELDDEECDEDFQSFIMSQLGEDFVTVDEFEDDQTTTSETTNIVLTMDEVADSESENPQTDKTLPSEASNVVLTKDTNTVSDPKSAQPSQLKLNEATNVVLITVENVTDSECETSQTSHQSHPKADVIETNVQCPVLSVQGKEEEEGGGKQNLTGKVSPRKESSKDSKKSKAEEKLESKSKTETSQITDCLSEKVNKDVDHKPVSKELRGGIGKKGSSTKTIEKKEMFNEKKTSDNAPTKSETVSEASTDDKTQMNEESEQELQHIDALLVEPIKTLEQSKLKLETETTQSIVSRAPEKHKPGNEHRNDTLETKPVASDEEVLNSTNLDKSSQVTETKNPDKNIETVLSKREKKEKCLSETNISKSQAEGKPLEPKAEKNTCEAIANEIKTSSPKSAKSSVDDDPQSIDQEDDDFNEMDDLVCVDELEEDDEEEFTVVDEMEDYSDDNSSDMKDDNKDTFTTLDDIHSENDQTLTCDNDMTSENLDEFTTVDEVQEDTGADRYEKEPSREMTEEVTGTNRSESEIAGVGRKTPTGASHEPLAVSSGGVKDKTPVDKQTEPARDGKPDSQEPLDKQGCEVKTEPTRDSSGKPDSQKPLHKQGTEVNSGKSDSQKPLHKQGTEVNSGKPDSQKPLHKQGTEVKEGEIKAAASRGPAESQNVKSVAVRRSSHDSRSSCGSSRSARASSQNSVTIDIELKTVDRAADALKVKSYRPKPNDVSNTIQVEIEIPSLEVTQNKDSSKGKASSGDKPSASGNKSKDLSKATVSSGDKPTASGNKSKDLSKATVSSGSKSSDSGKKSKVTDKESDKKGVTQELKTADKKGEPSKTSDIKTGSVGKSKSVTSKTDETSKTSDTKTSSAGKSKSVTSKTVEPSKTSDTKTGSVGKSKSVTSKTDEPSKTSDTKTGSVGKSKSVTSKTVEPSKTSDTKTVSVDKSKSATSLDYTRRGYRSQESSRRSHGDDGGFGRSRRPYDRHGRYPGTSRGRGYGGHHGNRSRSRSREDDKCQISIEFD